MSESEITKSAKIEYNRDAIDWGKENILNKRIYERFQDLIEDCNRILDYAQAVQTFDCLEDIDFL